MLRSPTRLRFFDPGTLVDAELQLVPPHHRLIEPMLLGLHAVQDPVNPGTEPLMTIAVLEQLLRVAPKGREKPGQRHRGSVGGYHFWLHLRREFRPSVPMAGSLSFRLSDSTDTLLYFGHVGYGIFPAARGRHYAERAVRLILPLARRHGMQALWITTNPENAASRRTCEHLGAELIEIVKIPPGHVLFERGEREKCRYRLPL